MPSPDIDKEEIQRQIVASEFKTWHTILEAKTDVIDVELDNDPIEREYEFALDRSGDVSSLVTVEEVKVSLLRADIPLEKFMGIKDPRIEPTQGGERWLRIQVTPEDPYRSRIGLLEERGLHFYHIEELGAYLSSLGRAYQEVTWADVLSPDAHPERRRLATPYLKQFPDDDKVVKFEKELETEEDIVLLQPLRGQTFERITFLRASLQRGNVIEGHHS